MKEPHSTDEELMTALTSGDSSRMDELFARYHDRIVGYCNKLTGNRETARDLAQETFMKVFDRRETFESGSNFSAWIHTVARNVCIDYLRRKQTISLDPAVIEMPDRQALAHDRLQHKQNLDRLARAIREIDPAKRELLLTVRKSRRGYRELAESFGCSVSALKVRVHRAMNELRSTYREMEHEHV